MSGLRATREALNTAGRSQPPAHEAERIDAALAEVAAAEAVIAAARACADEGRIRFSPEHGRLLLALRALDATGQAAGESGIHELKPI